VFICSFLSFFKKLPINWSLKKLGLENKNYQAISNTRRNCRYKNYEALKQCCKSILSVLNKEIENEADRDVNEAIGIMYNEHSFLFM